MQILICRGRGRGDLLTKRSPLQPLPKAFEKRNLNGRDVRSNFDLSECLMQGMWMFGVFARHLFYVIPTEPIKASGADLQNGNKAVLAVCKRRTFPSTILLFAQKGVV